MSTGPEGSSETARLRNQKEFNNSSRFVSHHWAQTAVQTKANDIWAPNQDLHVAGVFKSEGLIFIFQLFWQWKQGAAR